MSSTTNDRIGTDMTNDLIGTHGSKGNNNWTRAPIDTAILLTGFLGSLFHHVIWDFPKDEGTNGALNVMNFSYS